MITASAVAEDGEAIEIDVGNDVLEGNRGVIDEVA